MQESGKATLVSLLFEEGGRKMVNLKFFPGTGRGLTADQMCQTAAGAIKSAIDGGLRDEPPTVGVAARRFEEMAAA